MMIVSKFRRYHNSIKQFILIIFLFISSIFLNELYGQTERTPAFPGAEGLGMYAAGGRGGDIYHVINLKNDGPGSLRNGLKSAKGPRTIVFDVSGTIRLKSILNINKSNITIAGQTAPGDGITLADHQLDANADNLIVRYIRCRLGDKTRKKLDAIHISSGSNIIFDHVSASWSIDETFSFQSDYIDSLTVQWCMITESLRNSYHEKGSHGYGQIIGGLRQSVHHNLYAHHSSRSPKVSGRRHCEVDFRNNVIYNWGYNNCYDGTSSYINWVNNYYKPGPATKDNVRSRIFKLSDNPIQKENRSWRDSEKYETSLYANGNFMYGDSIVTEDNWASGIDLSDGATVEKNRTHTPFEFPPISEQSAVDAYPLVLQSAGASLTRDIVDHRTINEVISGSTNFGNDGIIDTQTDVGGWPQLNTLPAPPDSDNDGMPDYWEIEYGFQPNDPADGIEDQNENGYTNFEEYLNNTNPMDNLPVIYISLSVNRLFKNNDEKGYIIICRSDVLSENLSVKYEITGCRNKITPIVIPAGKSKIKIEINTRDAKNNELIIKVLPSTDYKIGLPGTALITIK